MKVIKITASKKLFGLLAVLAGSCLLAVTSCKKDDDGPLEPEIDLTEVGSGNSRRAFIGGDLHLEAILRAEGLIAKIEIEIHEENGSYEMARSYDEGMYIGTREVEFHEHIDIPIDAPAGAYHLHLTITDRQGKTASAHTELQLVEP